MYIKQKNLLDYKEFFKIKAVLKFYYLKQPVKINYSLSKLFPRGFLSILTKQKTTSEITTPQPKIQKIIPSVVKPISIPPCDLIFYSSRQCES